MASTCILPGPAAEGAPAALPSDALFKRLASAKPMPVQKTVIQQLWALPDLGRYIRPPTVVYSEAPIQAPRPDHAWSHMLLSDDFPDISTQLLHGHDPASTKPTTLATVHPDVAERVWMALAPSSSTKASIWRWTAEDEQIRQQILAIEESFQGGSSSLDLSDNTMGDVLSSPAEVGGAVRINSFKDCMNKIQGIFAFKENVDAVVEGIAQWVIKLNANFRFHYFHQFITMCEILVQARWGPERKVRVPKVHFIQQPPKYYAEFDEVFDNIEVAYLFADLWARLYRRALIDVGTFNRGCDILWRKYDDEDLAVLERVYTTVLELTKPPFHCAGFEHIQARLNAVRQAKVDRAFAEFCNRYM